MWPGKPESSDAPLFVHIAAGVFIGIVAAAFVIWRFAVWQSGVVAAEAAAALRQASEAVSVQRREAQDAAWRAQQAKREQTAAAQQAEETIKRQAQEETRRREAAWASFYRKSPACDESQGGSWTVDCANEFIRAKKKFAELYDAGKL